MQDINRDNAFDENESLSLNEKQKKSAYHEVGTAFGQLDKSRKIAVIFLAFFSIILFITWGITTKNRINNPLNPEVSTDIPAEIYQEEDKINVDSDGDGLTDWEEENLYDTSPYLEDSDSDGVSDSEEVNNGTNPTCKEGETCLGDVLQEEEQNKKNEVELNQFIDENINLQSEEEIDENNLSEVLEGGSDASTLREMLLDAGMDKTLLEAISDEDLLSSYKEILQ
ncbi:MAG: hypothetical protein PF572_05195 [Patescibacteria group bacterium]|jgi:hypothetical protein|nr:hypothetical protein [Patescibacteria group bacterium]